MALYGSIYWIGGKFRYGVFIIFGILAFVNILAFYFGLITPADVAEFTAQPLPEPKPTTPAEVELSERLHKALEKIKGVEQELRLERRNSSHWRGLATAALTTAAALLAIFAGKSLHP